jgi:hypothetical protein
LRNTVVPKVDIPLADTNANTCVAEVVGNKNDTVTGTSIVALIRQALAACATMTATTGTFAYLNAGGEQTIIEVVPSTTSEIIHSIWVDLSSLTLGGTIKLYNKIDGTNYREVESFNVSPGVTTPGFLFTPSFATNTSYKLTYTEAADEGADRNIVYRVMREIRSTAP